MDIKPVKKNFEEIASAVAKYATEKKRAPRAKKKTKKKKV
jgi:hypothetical protein